MPRYDFLCGSCGHEFEETVSYETTRVKCPHECGKTAERLPALIGGYQGNMGGGSTRPRKTPSNTGKKVFTGNDAQMEFDFNKKNKC